VAHWSSPFVSIYKRSGDTFTKVSNPATLPAAAGYGTAFSPNSTYLSVAHEQSPFITIYKRSGDTFTKLDNPATLPTGQGNGTAFSANGTYLAVAHNGSPFITIYKTTLTDSIPSFTEISKANNAILTDVDELGYALEDGTTGQTKKMVSLFKK
jgi:hypothetical protein